MAITRLNSLAIPAGTVETADLSYPLTNFSSTGIDDNATSTALTVTDSGIAATLTTATQPNVTSVGTLTGFTSTGIDDNATSTKLTVSDTGIDVTGTVTSDKAIVGYSRAAGTGGIVLYDDDQSENRLTLATGGGTGINAVINQAGGSFNITDASLNAVATFNDGGNVGIGVASPQRVLVLSKSDSTGVQTQYTNSTTGVGASNGFTVGIDGSENAELWNFQNTDMLFSTNGTERMRIDSSGSVGIGTSSPSTNAKFEVVSTSAGAVTNVIQLRNGDATAGSGAKLQFLNSTVNYATAGTSEITGVRYSGNYSALTFTTYGPTSLVERMRIDGIGRVGIGTTSPEVLTHLKSSDNTIFEIESTTATAYMKMVDSNTTGAGYIGYVTNDMTFWANNAERMRIDSSGNVGIGVTPTAGYGRKLQVHSAAGGGASVHITDSSTGTTASDGLELITFAGAAYIWNREASFMSFGTSATERMRIDSSGRVGIGTTSPGALLTLEDSNAELRFVDSSRTSKMFTQNGGRDLQIQANQDLIINSSGGTNVGIGTSSPSNKLEVNGATGMRADGGGYLTKFLNSSSTAGMSGYIYDNNQDHLQITAYDSSYALTFGTNNAERMRINSSGNIGIGTTGPISPLSVVAASGGGAIDVFGRSADGLGWIGFKTNNGSSSHAFIGTPATNTLAFYANGFTERMRIDSSGNVGIGTTNPGWRLHVHNTQSNYVAGYFTSQSSSTTEYGLLINLHNDPNDTSRYFLVGRGNNNQTTRFHVASNGNVTNTNNSYGSISDEKLKENIVDSGSQWEDIKALRVRKYSMKEDALDAPNKLGVIAQEVEAAGMQGLVIDSTDMDENNNDLGTITKTVNYSILYMKAVKALQEAMDRIETLETEVAALKGA